MTDLRRFLRVAKEYQVEYGPFPQTGQSGPLKPSVVTNIGGGGLLFNSEETIEVGSQLLLRIFVPGWRRQGDEIVESPDENEVAVISAIAEVRHVDFDQEKTCYSVGVQFLGRVLP